MARHRDVVLVLTGAMPMPMPRGRWVPALQRRLQATTREPAGRPGGLAPSRPHMLYAPPTSTPWSSAASWQCGVQCCVLATDHLPVTTAPPACGASDVVWCVPQTQTITLPALACCEDEDAGGRGGGGGARADNNRTRPTQAGAPNHLQIRHPGAWWTGAPATHSSRARCGVRPCAPRTAIKKAPSLRPFSRDYGAWFAGRARHGRAARSIVDCCTHYT
jgi:hypothetical protein